MILDYSVSYSGAEFADLFANYISSVSINQVSSVSEVSSPSHVGRYSERSDYDLLHVNFSSYIIPISNIFESLSKVGF